MAGDTGPTGTRRTFRIQGGECVVGPRALHADQTFLRHHHVLGWIFTAAAALCAGYSFVTGWQYTTGTGVLIGWESFLVLTGLMVAIPGWRRIRDWYGGYTAANTIRLEDIESVTLTSTDIRWYFKTRKSVPVCVIRYRTDGETRKRRFKLPLRSGREEMQEAVDAFEDVGIQVERDVTEDEIPAATVA